MFLNFFVTFDWYLVQLILLFNPDFNCSSNFVLSWVDKVSTRRWRFVSVIAKVDTLSPSEITPVADQFRISLVLQLVKGISRVLQKLPKYFNSSYLFLHF